MLEQYSVVSPSLDGIISHESMVYEGIARPTAIFRACESRMTDINHHHKKVLEQYFYDLYGVFMKKFSGFVMDMEYKSDEPVKLQAMLQEMIKTKKLIARG